MILNLSPYISDIKKCAEYFRLELQQESIVDYSCNIRMSLPGFYSVCQLENFETINDQNARDFIKDIGDLSLCEVDGKSIREIKILEHSLFWITDLAIKHPFNSIAKTVFLLRETFPLLKKKLTAGDRIYLSLPSGGEHFIPLVQKILKENGIENVSAFQAHKPLSKWFLKSVLQASEFYFKTLFSPGSSKKMTIPGEHNSHDYYLTYAGDKPVDATYRDSYLHTILELGKQIRPSHYWPIFTKHSVLKNSVSFLPPGYLNGMPGISQFARLMISAIRHFFLRKMNTISNTKSLFAESGIIDWEMKNALIGQLQNLLWSIWIKNFFKKNKTKARLFYQDEFYPIGRMIAQSLGSLPHVSKVGVQHGLFDLHHTVYGISNQEIDKAREAPLPIPDAFIVWGSYFRDYFLSNNQLGNDFVRIIGSHKHLLTMYKENGKHSDRSKVKILWCTDSQEITQNNFFYLKDAIFDSSQYQVTVRMHPLYDITDYLRNDLLKDFGPFSISKASNIVDDILANDIVIVNCYTTAFLDAYLAGRPCLRLFPYKHSPAYLKHFISNCVFNIFDKGDVLVALVKIKECKYGSASESTSEIMKSNPGEWESLLKQESIYLS